MFGFCQMSQLQNCPLNVYSGFSTPCYVPESWGKFDFAFKKRKKRKKNKRKTYNKEKKKKKEKWRRLNN